MTDADRTIVQGPDGDPGRRRLSRRRRSMTIGWYVVMTPAIAAALLVVVPPPTYGLWVASVYAIEISFAFVMLSLLGVLLAALVWRVGRRRLGMVLSGISVLALVGTAVPTILATVDARARHVSLSPARYFGDLVASTDRVPQTITYASVGGVDLRLDVWLPDGTAGQSRPALVVVHGGGWEGGRRSSYPLWNTWLVERGYVVFDIEYRLAPPPRWSDAVGDVKCAVGWVRANAARYSVDGARIGLLGRSAGGHLALLAAYSSGDDRLAPSCPVAGSPPAGTSVASVVALYPPADLAYTYGVGPSWSHPPAITDAGRRFLRGFTGGTPEQVPDVYQLASPINHVSAGAPATLLVQGGWDRLKVPADTARLATRVRAVGVRCDLIEIAYADHAFDANWAGWGSQLLRPALSRFLADTLGGAPA